VGAAVVVTGLDVVVGGGVDVAGSPPQEMRINETIIKMAISPLKFLFTNASSTLFSQIANPL
jgi:hypothetical protein